ncbi:MAG: retroviral-like aspartic protease family protein, partial [Cytophagales bacterium]|nr:retroviral-like aspartic protease family protein [Cytophagales bacterium]
MLYVPARISLLEVHALLDTGATVSCISPEILEHLPAHSYRKYECNEMFHSADRKPIYSQGKVKLRITIEGKSLQYVFYIINDLPAEVLLGSNFLSSFQTLIDYAKNELRFTDGTVVKFVDPDAEKSEMTLALVARDICLPRLYPILVPLTVTNDLNSTSLSVQPSVADKGIVAMRCVISGNRPCVMMMNISPKSFYLRTGMTVGTVDSCEVKELNPKSVNVIMESKPMSPAEIEELVSQIQINTELASDQQTSLKELLKKYADIFRKNFDSPSITNVVEHSIETNTDAPISAKPYRVSQKEQIVIRNEVAKMLQMGIIRKSKSAWASPVVLVTKKDGSIRFCVDYRKLNTVTVNDAYPLPNIEDNLNHLRGKKYFSSMDAISGFFQIPMKESDIPKTAFITADGLYEFLVMPFGIKTNSACFQRMMDHILDGIRYSFILSYIDDVLCYSNTFEEHLQHLEILFQRLREANIKLKVSKCTFGMFKVLYLGYIVSSAGIAPDPDKVEAIKKFKAPTNQTELKSFLGLCNYYRKFIGDYALVAKCLTDLTGKSKTWQWTDQH